MQKLYLSTSLYSVELVNDKSLIYCKKVRRDLWVVFLFVC